MFLLSARFPEVYYVQKITKGKVATIFKAMEISCLENQYAISVPIFVGAMFWVQIGVAVTTGADTNKISRVSRLIINKKQ